MNIFFLSIGIIFIIFFIFNFLYFILPSLSPVPFFPSNKKDLPLISEILLGANKRSVIIDLGAGTGTVIFAAALAAFRQKLALHFLAVEIHPLLVLIMLIRRLFHPNKENIFVIKEDMLKMDYPTIINPKSKIINSKQFQNPKSAPLNHLTVYLYVGHLVIEKIKKKLLTLPKTTTIISYMYDIPHWKRKLVAKKKGLHSLYIYRL